MSNHQWNEDQTIGELAQRKWESEMHALKAQLAEAHERLDELRQRILDSCPSPDEGGRIHAGGRIVCGQCHDSEVSHLRAQLAKADLELRELRVADECGPATDSPECSRGAEANWCRSCLLARYRFKTRELAEAVAKYRAVLRVDMALVEQRDEARAERDALKAERDEAVVALRALVDGLTRTHGDEENGETLYVGRIVDVARAHAFLAKVKP